MLGSLHQRISGLDLGTQPKSFTESNGWYERVPIRVGEFTLVKNEEGEVVFETTAQEFCRDGPKIQISIVEEDDGWSVREKHGCYRSFITPSVDLHSEKLARRRAFWHAGQHMNGVELSKSERFTIIHQTWSDNPNVFDDDAFFRNGDPVTIDPFGEFLPA